MSALRRRESLAVLVLFVGLLFAYLANGDVLPGNDAKGSVELSLSVLREGDLSFRPTEVPSMFRWTTANGESVKPQREGLAERIRNGELRLLGGKYYVTPTQRTDARTGEPLFVNTFGIGAALTALPVLAPVQLVAGDLSKQSRLLWLGAKTSAALCVAGSAVLLFLAMKRHARRSRAWVLATAYGLGTCVWSTSSQTLWQHGPNELFLALGIFFFWRDDVGRRAAFGAGLAFALATACRPTSAAFAVAGFVYFAWKERAALVPYVLGALPVALALAAYDTYYLGAPWRSAQLVGGAAIALRKTGDASLLQTPIWEGALGLLVSPSRGLFVFSPFLLLSVGGAWLVFRTSGFVRLRVLVVATLAVLAVESMHFDWWGGWSYGYRHIVDLAVPLTVFIVPTLDWLYRRPVRLAAWGALVAWSVFVQVLGAFAYDLGGWNAPSRFTMVLPEGATVTVDAREAERLRLAGARETRHEVLDVDSAEHRGRLWSVTDNEISFYGAHPLESRRAKLALQARVFSTASESP